MPPAKLEDVRMSNYALTQIKIGEIITVIFSTIGIFSAIISSEMQYHNKRGQKDSDIQTLLSITMMTSIFMCISVIFNYQLLIRWQRCKNMIIETDNLFNTGLHKKLCFECFVVLI
jgi:hypothetical protein